MCPYCALLMSFTEPYWQHNNERGNWNWNLRVWIKQRLNEIYRGNYKGQSTCLHMW